ncbi:MAG: hypothetical protein QOG83_613 [Alphaproteobacteria bacterium]|nr:hypothetical protein [Alphaproteobacteria bacterium]
MKQSSTRELFDYWNTRRGLRPAPDRADIEPGAIRRVLADTFILAFDARGDHPFRIAGTRVCAAFGRELKGEAFVRIWSEASRATVRDLLAVVGNEAVAAVASARGINAEGVALELELLMLPLGHRGRTDARVLGALVPSQMPYWFGISMITELTLGTLRYLAPGAVPASVPGPQPAVPAGRLRHGLVVYDGGQI